MVACKFNLQAFCDFYHFTDIFGSENGTMEGKRGIVWLFIQICHQKRLSKFGVIR
jgi:hypothetical protein